MAIAFDAATDGGNNSGITDSLTFSHTCTGTDLVLWVGLSGDVSAGADDISSVTYAGAALSLVGKVQGTSSRWVYLYVKTNPATGANDVVITAGSSHYLIGVACSYTGAHITQPDGTPVTGSNVSDTSLSLQVTTTVDNAWAVMVGHADNGITGAGTATTQRVLGSPFDLPGFYDSDGVVSPAGNRTLTFNCNNSPVGGVIASMAPAGGSIPTDGRILIAPVGFS